MLAVVCKHYYLGPTYGTLWFEYLERIREHREFFIEKAMKSVRFQVLARSGRDLDWIRAHRDLPPGWD